MPTMEFTMKRLYREATVPYPAEFRNGKRYKVIALPGVPKLPCHYKYFDGVVVDRATQVIGYNKSIIKWGSLVVVEGQGCVQFEYEHWGIVDYVKRVSDGVYVGKFYQHGKFKGYFLLIRED